LVGFRSLETGHPLWIEIHANLTLQIAAAYSCR
jgi:hypothetical protein